MKPLLCFIYDIQCYCVNIFWPARWWTSCQCIAHSSWCLLGTLNHITLVIAWKVALWYISDTSVYWIPATTPGSTWPLWCTGTLWPTIWPLFCRNVSTLWCCSSHILHNSTFASKVFWLNRNVLLFYLLSKSLSLYNFKNVHIECTNLDQTAYPYKLIRFYKLCKWYIPQKYRDTLGETNTSINWN